ncbi:NAD(P)-binding protein [Trametopsis cervina]|nr:NAD(P)-binding protein [Trametopsis cervina]
MVDAIPRQPTHRGYAVVGGSGWMASYLVRLLLLRGETSIRVVDIQPPAPALLNQSGVTYVHTDITSLPAVEAALLAPFHMPATGKEVRVSVVYHCAAIIRFWERASYTYHTSYRVNVLGTQNVLDVARRLAAPGEPNPIVIYTSSADVVLPRPRFMKLGKDYTTWPYNTVVVSDGDPPLGGATSAGCYVRSKAEAEKLVVEANGKGLRTGVLRPGQTIIGPNDRLLTSTLMMPRVPVWDKEWAHTDVCVWDSVAAHLLLEDALQHRPQEVAGQAFLISGDGPPWTMRETRNAIKHYSSKDLVFKDLPVLLIYVLAHLIEGFLWSRYYVLLPIFLLFHGSKPNLTPRWMGDAVFLQPSTLEYMRDVVIDDSRARKVLGYRPLWSTAQAIRYTVEQLESGSVKAEHGLKVK